jgi:hypothetical protein
MIAESTATAADRHLKPLDVNAFSFRDPPFLI